MVTPLQGSRRNPAKRFRWEKEEQRRESEFRPGGRNEGCGACDNATVQEQGVSKILTIHLNDMAKELKITEDQIRSGIHEAQA